ncbi:sensor histidine kinase [Kitasatospora sp. NPDC101235]|uniref:sensor histidine kinase n=1 Tax=Kitasatospora sp. NPDC101235 TaxID=3364101 RepID=UPI00380E2BB5
MGWRTTGDEPVLTVPGTGLLGVFGPDPGGPRSRWGLLIGSLGWLVPLIGMAPPISSYPSHGQDLVAVLGVLGFGATHTLVTWSFHTDRLSLGLRCWLCGFLAVSATALPLVLDEKWIVSMPYLAAAVSLSVPERLLFTSVAAPVLLAMVVARRVEPSETIPAIVMTLAAGLAVATYRRMLTLIADLRSTRLRLAGQAVVEERLRIARDLHDLLGHTLLNIVLKAEYIRRVQRRAPEPGNPHSADVLAEAEEIERIGREAIEHVRQAVTGYREHAMTAAIDSARSCLTDAGISVRIRSEATPLPSAVESAFSWVIREGVTNIVRHSGADHCDITVGLVGGMAELEVRDNGTGPVRPPQGAGGNGLAGLSERVALLGGRLSAGSGPAGGFRLRVVLPLAGIGQEAS